MKITLKTNGGRTLAAGLPYPTCAHVTVGEHDCPECGDDLLAVRCPVYTTSHDTMQGDAVAMCCGATVGRLTVKMATLFGIEEDRRTMHGRARVY